MRHDFNDGKYTVISDYHMHVLRNPHGYTDEEVREARLWSADQVERLQRQNEILYAERDHARACTDNAVKLLSGIHALLYPPAFTTPDGRTMVFRPKDPDPHEVLQWLSDRIRALPDELDKLRAQSTAQPSVSPPLSL